ncbi:hypothetical protein ASPCADRAFT_156409 [Aspergillus carbonarius ITEM 5010]|uniref:DUF7924 domain-containing protein n=1 Tax=Aspergillus carbonarius (strain ITEM 5010) TaxID=602072 RepID=A0A1R3R8C0_ASPC5|nr:hypothetical protein ASPCADRAFT_156409 [Aspergillus carbonarius ITEM 5010]
MKRSTTADEDHPHKRRQTLGENRLPLPVSIPRRNQDPNFVYDWIPPPGTDLDPTSMEQPPSKRSRAGSVSSDRGRPASVSSGYDSRSSSRDARSSTYRDSNYVTILETKHCYMRESPTGPLPEDIELCKQLLQQPAPVPPDTLFEPEYMQQFHDALLNRSEMRLLVDLHPLLMPTAENQFLRGRQSLQHVIDGYNDLWMKTEPIYGSKPQPDHTRSLKWSTFDETQRQKLGVRPNEKSVYTAREEMYFPYLTGEVKCGLQALEIADRQNFHSMCVALRGLVHLARTAGCVEAVHRRILGFSISHDLETARIYGYYPEIEGDKTSYYRRSIARVDIWAEAEKWTCYRFVHSLDVIFLPRHIQRVMDMLDRIPQPRDISLLIDIDDAGEAQSLPESEEDGPTLRRSMALRSRGLQPEVRAMIQTVQQQVDQQSARFEQERQEQKAQEVTLRAQLEQQTKQLEQERRERKEHEERLHAQWEQERREQKEQQERLLAQFERLVTQAINPK